MVVAPASNKKINDLIYFHLSATFEAVFNT